MNDLNKLRTLPKTMFKTLLRTLGMKRAASDSVQPRRSDTDYIMPPTSQIPNLGSIYKQYFSFRRDGTFVEFGAFDGEYASNTSGLADAGWFGFYIEPVPKFFELCKVRHAKNEHVKVFKYAIGDAHETKTLYVGGPLSTLNPKIRDTFSRIEWAKGYFNKGEKIEVEVITLEDFLTTHGVPKNFEVLNIDVEGQEWNVLKNFDIQKWAPKMAIIELHDQNDNYLSIREECNNIVSYFDKNGYKVIYKDWTNTIYVPRDLHPITFTGD
jgi:FkbM family methyltransferase